MAFRLLPGEADPAGLHEINVTPFIDVMLVLLIIFMVAAPLATVNVPLDLPVSSAQARPEPHAPVIVSVRSDLKLYVGDRQTSREALGAAVQQALAQPGEGPSASGSRIFLRADKDVSYGDLMQVMDALRRSGYLKVALVTLDRAQR